MWKAIEYFKDPQLVAKVQKYYGVKVLPSSSSINGNVNSTLLQNDEITKTKKRPRTTQHEENSVTSNVTNSTASKNGYLPNELETEETLSSESESEVKDYIVTNWFWYYLFVLGTALGDEIFYASFIPFWFWNIDGAVGRRVVLVWTAIMYIGMYLTLEYIYIYNEVRNVAIKIYFLI